MNDGIPRLRMFAGPNGSGKSTFKSMLRPELIGIYINPDEIEKEIFEHNFLDLRNYQVTTTAKEIIDFFTHSSLLKAVNLIDKARHLHFNNEKLIFQDVKVNAYYASVVADFIRNKLIESSTSFTFETVMSFPDKIELLRKAQLKGYRTYLYYIATEDPSINISRIQYRIKMGGHPVPEDKILSRYHRSLDLLMQAIRSTNRSYIFDNSTHEQIWLAEITNGRILKMKTDHIPIWFQKALLNRFNTES